MATSTTGAKPLPIRKADYGYRAESAARDSLGLAVRAYYIDRPHTLQPAEVARFWTVRIFEGMDRIDTIDGEFESKRDAVAFVRAYEEYRALSRYSSHYDARRSAMGSYFTAE